MSKSPLQGLGFAFPGEGDVDERLVFEQVHHPLPHGGVRGFDCLEYPRVT